MNEALFNQDSMGIVVVNSKGLIQSANAFALELVGYTIDELLGEPIEKLIPHRYRQAHVEHRETFNRHPRNRTMGVGMDLFALRKDGTEFPVEVSLSNYQNQIEQNTIAFLSDISVRKKAEAENVKLKNALEETVQQRTKDLTNAMHQLKMSNERLERVLYFQKALLDNAGAMIIATDPVGLITLFNPEASKNLGYSEAEVVNRSTPVMFHIVEEIESKRQQIFTEHGVQLQNNFSVLVENARRNTHEEVNYTYRRKDGSQFPVSLTITALKDRTGMIAGFMGIAIDISERKKTEEILSASLKQEKELSELKTKFVAMASHEFRSPLSTILTSAYLIQKYPMVEDQSKRDVHVTRIVSSVNMLKDILNDFMSIDKIEEGKIPVKQTSFQLQNLLTSVLEEMENNLRKDQQINYQHTGDTTVLMDSSLLKHIVINLVSNASKFSPEGSPIEIKTNVADHQVSLSVKDNGIGIPEEDQAHLMERFFRSSNAAHIQGTGLGLHIVAKYAELMGGVVLLTSELGAGTEIKIEFNTG
jgi:PAS domain S-box-containing protein